MSPPRSSGRLADRFPSPEGKEEDLDVWMGPPSPSGELRPRLRKLVIGHPVKNKDESLKQPSSPTSPTTGVASNYCTHLQVIIGQNIEKIAELPKELYSPTSPIYPIIGVNVNDDTQSDTEEEIVDSVDDESEDDEDAMQIEEADKKQSTKYAELALHYYNEDQKNEVKYELIRGITSVGIMDASGYFGHVNFIAKAKLEYSKEELFFAELHYNGYKSIMMPTCVYSLEGKEQAAGCKEVIAPWDIYIDPHHCYACSESLMHPKDGTLYQFGHHAHHGFNF